MKTKHLFLAFAAAAVLVGCTKPAQETPLPDEAAYRGKLTVIEIGDALFEMENIKATYDWDGTTLNVSLYDVSFSSKMPVTLNQVMLPAVPYTKSGNKLILSGTDIIPLMESRGTMVPYERYACTDLTGEITPERIVLSMKLGGFQTDYTGLFTEAE